MGTKSLNALGTLRNSNKIAGSGCCTLPVVALLIPCPATSPPYWKYSNTFLARLSE
ncbi:Uncharacterised protein [Vibrio cholerae]|nr:Uncharacterised protein [Vibrio cholerae]